MRRYYLLILGCFWVVFAQSQNLKKGFDFLKTGKLTEANAIFRASVDRNKDLAVAYSGLAQLLIEQTISNPDSAYWFAIQCEILLNAAEKKQREKWASDYGLTASKTALLRRLIASTAYRKLDKKDISQLEGFVHLYHNEPVSNQARELIDELRVFLNLRDTDDIAYYWRIIEKYPNNEQINKVWRKFYEIATADGDLLTIQGFIVSYPSCPLDSLLERDQIVARMADQCFEKGVIKDKNLCIKYIERAAPKHRAFVILQNLLQGSINAQQWDIARRDALRYAQKFGQNKIYLDFIKLLEQRDETVIKTNIGQVINSPEGSEYSPVLSANGKHLYFAGYKRKDNLGGEDIFIASFENGQWQHPELQRGVNTSYGNEAPEAVSTDEQRMVLYYNGDIYQSNRTAFGWETAKRINNINTEQWDGDAVLSADGTALLFASEGWQKSGVRYMYRSSEEGFDIYVSLRQSDNSWGRPISLGNTINTPYCDRYPFLHPDGRTLYFSSSGRGGLGGTDVYKSVRLNDSLWTEWSIPENLGKSINSSNNDNGYKISTDGQCAIYSSKNGASIDLYTLRLPSSLRPNEVALISGTLLDENGAAIDVGIQVEDLSTGRIVATFNPNTTTGQYLMVLPLGKHYGYHVDARYYFPVSGNIDLRNAKSAVELQQDVRVVSFATLIGKSQAVAINNVFFDTDQFILKPTSFGELRRLVRILKEHEDYIIEVGGHTDNTGNEQHNIELSANRATAVASFLIDNGCAASQISTRGYGSSQPILPNITEDGKAKNRRVEIRFSKRDKK